MLQCRVVEGPEWAAELRNAWSELAAQSASLTPFQTLEWQSAWMRHFGRGKRPYVWTCWEGRDAVGIFPMVRSPGPWRALRPMGVGASDYLHPLAAPGYEREVADALVCWLRQERGADLVDLHQLRESEALAAAISACGWSGASTFEQATCLVLELPSTFERYLSSLGKSLRYDVKRLDKLATKGIRVVDVGPGDVVNAMERFFEFHRMRWRKRGLPGAFVGKGARAFHTAWAVAAAEMGWLRMSLLSVDGRPAGAIYAMAIGETWYFYQSGFDPAYGGVSPGTLLVAHAIQRAIEHGCSRFDFLRGDEPYKRRWKPQHVNRNLRFLAPTNGFLGRIAQAWNGVGFRVETRVRSRLEGRSLV